MWQRFQYDAANRLVVVKADDNSTVRATYTYGDSNEHLIDEEAGLRTYYAFSGIAEYIESGGSTTLAWSKSYVYLGNRLLSTLTPNGTGGEAVELGAAPNRYLKTRFRKLHLAGPPLRIITETSHLFVPSRGLDGIGIG